MQNRKLPSNPSVLKAVFIFLFAILTSVIIWVQIKDFYNYTITLAASKVLAVVKDATLASVESKGDLSYISLGFFRGKQYHSFSLVNDASRYYAFNVPLTVSLLASLSLFVKRRMKAYTQALFILLLSHFMFVFFMEAVTVTEQSMLKGIEAVNVVELSVYQYLWKAMEFIVMSFGPFLIALYVLIRFRKA